MNANIDGLIKAINAISSRDSWDYIFFVIPIIVNIVTTLINIWLVNKNTNKQIENQNRETYRPRLRLNDINLVKSNVDKRHLYAHSLRFKDKAKGISLYAEVILENIGNGIANNLTFYMLNNGNKCIGIQAESKDTNQILNSTLEVPKDKNETINFLFEFNGDQLNVNNSSLEDDVILLICNYKDLNNNNYKILIGCILKKYEPFTIKKVKDDETDKTYNDGKCSIYYYQEGTVAYNAMVKKELYKENYKRILNDIENND